MIDYLRLYANWSLHHESKTGEPKNRDFVNYVRLSYGLGEQTVNDSNSHDTILKIKANFRNLEDISTAKSFFFQICDVPDDDEFRWLHIGRILLNMDTFSQRMAKMNKIELKARKTLRPMHAISKKEITIEDAMVELFEWIIENKDESVALKYNSVIICAMHLLKSGYKLPEKTNEQNLISRYYELDRVIDLESLQDIYFSLDELKVYRNKISARHLMGN